MLVWRGLLILLLAAGCVDLGRPSYLVQGGPEAGLPADRPRDDSVSPAEGQPDGPEDPDADGPPPHDGEDQEDGNGPPEVDVATPDASPPDLPPIVNGQPCSEGSQCASGHCVSGLCCDGPCTELCRACNIAGKLGACSPVPAGEDPRDQCPRDQPASCMRDGSCDGSGACRRYPANTECAPGSCSSATERAASLCNGSGSCQPGATRSCAPNLCMGATCGTTCTGDSQCQNGFYCAGGRCAVKLVQGASCTTANQCASGFCVDRTCCAGPCTGLCFACNLAGQLGTCSPVPAGQDPRQQCLAQPASGCGLAGGCNGSGACRLHPAGTPCAAVTCSGSTETAARSCNGLGTCAPGATRGCAPYTCGAGACATSCSAGAGCQAGFPCVGDRCSPLGALALLWRFEEASGGTAADGSGNNLGGSFVGNGGPQPSLLVPTLQHTNSRSRAFDRDDRNAVQLSPLPASLRPSTNFTVAAWYRATSLDSNGGEVVSGGNAYVLRLRPGQAEFSVRQSDGDFAQCFMNLSVLLDGGWHHLAGTHTAGRVECYFDGVRRATVTASNVFYGAAGPDFWVGRHGNGESQWDFNGNIDEVRIYTRALSGAEIAALAAGAP